MSRFIGALLIAAGVLIAALSGLCSFSMIASSIGPIVQGSGGGANFAFGLVLVLVFGGVPFGVGIALIVGGRGLLRSSAAPPPPPSVQPPDGPRADL